MLQVRSVRFAMRFRVQISYDPLYFLPIRFELPTYTTMLVSCSSSFELYNNNILSGYDEDSNHEWGIQQIEEKHYMIQTVLQYSDGLRPQHYLFVECMFCAWHFTCLSIPEKHQCLWQGVSGLFCSVNYWINEMDEDKHGVRFSKRNEIECISYQYREQMELQDSK